jgi:hypothetical protein
MACLTVGLAPIIIAANKRLSATLVGLSQAGAPSSSAPAYICESHDQADAERIVIRT